MELIERLVGMKAPSQSKSYFIGLERGRIWAEDGDYIEVRRWSAFRGEYLDVALPDYEEMHYLVLNAESRIEWVQFVRGWIDGVKSFKRQLF